MEPLAATAEELVRMRQRAREVEDVLKETEAEEVRIGAELAKVEAQAGYYESLAGDMKRDLQPPKLAGLIRSLRW
ncbi:MAG: hypothetical protein E6K18_07515 [Methanobacteriota archaeon]|nr:MAG: hypothetical protein E6K18_07515 [Euryarchaeota archaeon]